MEQRLKQLFDYQKFEPNDKLQKMIDDVEAKYSGSPSGVTPLSLDDLDLVSAAGEPGIYSSSRKKQT